MLNEFVYCPRLAYLEWVQREWEDSADTVEGRRRHGSVDRREGPVPEPEAIGTGYPVRARSVEVSASELGLIARIDLLEEDGAGGVVPVDFKRGKRPHVARGAYEPERVQVCAQGLILRELGYRVTRGAILFLGSRERVEFELDDHLVERTREAIRGLRDAVAREEIPPPLVGSPKCPRCSLVSICLPDEVSYLRGGSGDVRPLSVPKTESFPLHVTTPGAFVALAGETLEIEFPNREGRSKEEVRLAEVSEVVLQGAVQISTPAVHELLSREIPVSFYSHGGWFLGLASGLGHKNVELRTAQYRASFDSDACVRIARDLVRAKILNQRTLLRRNWRGPEKPDETLVELKQLAEAAGRSRCNESLLGIEGTAAAIYFEQFPNMLSERSFAKFDFRERNRRPPRDPVNAVLSFAYAMLTRACFVALHRVGFDPFRGFYHAPRYGRPSLALDLMEPFRPLVGDSIVLQVFNNGEVRESEFLRRAGAVSLNDRGRKAVIGAFERRMEQEIVHPVFGYAVSYRRLLVLQARLLARHLQGEIPEVPHVVTR